MLTKKNDFQSMTIDLPTTPLKRAKSDVLLFYCPLPPSITTTSPLDARFAVLYIILKKWEGFQWPVTVLSSFPDISVLR